MHRPADISTIGPQPQLSASGPATRIQHIAFYTRGNAGDTVLVSALRAAFERALGRLEWSSQHAHWRFGGAALDSANASDIVVVGGGGLFVADTNRNARSGWQWDSSISDVHRITTPLVVFGVGYNRFRGQPEFSPVFTEHVTAVAERAEYIGLRNSGSITALQEYLPTALHHKLRFQPCPTTLLAKLAPLLVEERSEEYVVGVNLAYDRPQLRFGGRVAETLAEIGDALRTLEGDGATIEFLAQCPEDERTIPGLGPLRTLRINRLYGRSAADVAVAYGRPLVVIGMRGHSQMIPFGMRRPIVSLISHDKLRFFLDDIGRPEWGIETGVPFLSHVLVERVRDVLEHRGQIENDIAALQEDLWTTTMENLSSIGDGVTSPRARELGDVAAVHST